MKTFKINEQLGVICRSEDTRYGFRHTASLMRDSNEIDFAKCCYYNRTWESYEFESVLEKLLEKTKVLTDKEKSLFAKVIKDPQRVEDDLAPFKIMGNLAKLGDVLCNDKAEKNEFKKACVGNMGLDFPDDWNDLPEEEKERRLNGVIDIVKGKG